MNIMMLEGNMIVREYRRNLVILKDDRTMVFFTTASSSPHYLTNQYPTLKASLSHGKLLYKRELV